MKSLTLAAIAMLALSACGDGGTPTPPQYPGGDYAAVLVSPNALEGAALIELTGTGITGVRRNGSYVASSTIPGGYRVVLIRSFPGTLDFIVTLAPGSAVTERRREGPARSRDRQSRRSRGSGPGPW